MKNNLLTFILALLTLCMWIPSDAQAGNKKDDPLQYDIAVAGSGVQGTYLVKVAVFSKSKKVTDAQIIKAAIHGVLFKGVPGTGRVPTQHPIAGSANAENDHPEFYEEFFAEGGDYLNYGTIVPNTYTHVKLSKGYKVGAVVQVMKDDLRRAMENANVVRGLSSGF